MDRWRAIRLAVGFALAMGAVVPAVGTADQVPRPPGAVDGRGWELVSQADKNGFPVIDGLLSADGNRVLYNLYGGAPGTLTGARPKLLATRSASGWVSTSPMPPRTEMPADSYAVEATTPDFSLWIASAQDSIGQEELSPDVSLLRVTDTGAQTLLHTFPVYFGASGAEVLASRDLSHVYTDAPERLDPSHRIGTTNVYDVGSDTPQLVSRMPGTNLAPSCGVPRNSYAFADYAPLHWVSDDGSQVFFMTRGSDAPACTAQYQLYLRDVDLGTTRLISGPPVSGDADAGVDRFLGAAPDGSWAYFRTATSLVPADDADGGSTDQDVYRWSVTGGLTCATCVVPNAQVEPGDSQAAVSADGSHVYFSSAARFGDAPAAATDVNPNLYVLRNGVVHFVARIGLPLARGQMPPPVTSLPLKGGALTPDGDVLIFRNARPELNTASANNGGTQQYYRYDDLDQTVTCISCPPGGAPATSDVPDFMAISTMAVPPDRRVMTDDGQRVFFMTDQALVPEDVNGTRDVYEWSAGTLHLITDGVTPALSFTTLPELLTVSPDGRDVLFLDPTRLTPEAQDGAHKLYDAREGGGFPPPPPPPAPCVADACHGAPMPAPALVGPSSSSTVSGGYQGAGSATRFAVEPLSRAQRRALARVGRAIVTVRLRAAGRVSLRAQARIGGRIRTVAHASRSLPRAGAVRLRLALSRAARSQLRHGHRLIVVVVIGCSNSTAYKRLVLSLKEIAR